MCPPVDDEDERQVTQANSLLAVQWPLSLPHVNESFCFSIIVGNTSLKWATHHKDENYAPSLYWRYDPGLFRVLSILLTFAF